MLTDPDSTPQNLISLARLDLRKKALDFALKKHVDALRTPVQKAFVTLELNAFMNHDAQFAIGRLKEAFRRPKRWPEMEAYMKKHGYDPQLFGFDPETAGPSGFPVIPTVSPASHA